jgi:hypothetical protein
LVRQAGHARHHGAKHDPCARTNSCSDEQWCERVGK